MTMMSRLLHSRPFVAFASATAAALIVGGVARATIPSSDGVIHGCFSRADGSLRVINAENGKVCASNEKPLNWNQGAPRLWAKVFANGTVAASSIPGVTVFKPSTGAYFVDFVGGPNVSGCAYSGTVGVLNGSNSRTTAAGGIEVAASSPNTRVAVFTDENGTMRDNGFSVEVFC